MEQTYQAVDFSEQDFQILESYKTVVDGLADYLGEGYEIVLHSLHDLNHSVIKIINGQHTGRKEGSPITDLALSMLERIREQSGVNHISYFNKNMKGEPLKASTITIRGSGGNVIGLLCINFYLNTPLHAFLQGLLPKPEAMPDSMVTEHLVENADDLIAGVVKQVSQRVTNDPGISPANKNKEIIGELFQRGIFNLKDSVIKVADQLNISKNTVYLHMRNLGNNGKL